jgi:hypothetical protein
VLKYILAAKAYDRVALYEAYIIINFKEIGFGNMD